MIKGYYLYFGTKSSGVTRKIESQCDALQSLGPISVIRVGKGNRNLTNKIISRLPWKPVGYELDEVLGELENPDYLYIRRCIADKEFVSFLRDVKKKWPKCIIIEEIYTYPYDKDDFNRNLGFFLKEFPFYFKDVHYRKYLKYFIDRFVTFSDDDIIFGVQTIRTMNGIDVNTIKERIISQSNRDTINIISVAHMQVHHGYERFIKGLHRYYIKGGKKNIIYHCVGDGDQLLYYKKLARKFKLESNIIFYGRKTGSELDDIYNKADIGLSSLGLYKYGIGNVSTLKTSEYLAKGFPVIIGCKPSLISSNLPEYIKVLPNNSSDVDVEEIISFYDNLIMKYNKQQLSDIIREYAKNYIDMSKVMQPVVDYILLRISQNK